MSNNPLIDWLLSPELSSSLQNPKILYGLLFALVCALVFHSWTDLYRGRQLYNSTNLLIAACCISVVPFIYTGHFSDYFIGLGVSWGFIIIITFVGAIKMGDTKLYGAMAILLSQATIVFIFISWAIVLLYSIPIIIKSVRENKGKKVPRGQRMGTAPAGPAIALAFVPTLYLLGLPLESGAKLIAFGFILFGLSHLYRFLNKNNQLDENADESSEVVISSPDGSFKD